MCIFLWRIGIWKKWNNIDRDQYFTDKLTTVHQDIVRAKLTFVRFFFVVHFLSDHCPPPKHVAEISLKLKLKSLGQNFFFWLIIRLVEEIGVRQAVSCTSQTLVWKLVNCICSWHVDILSEFRVCQKKDILNRWTPGNVVARLADCHRATISEIYLLFHFLGAVRNARQILAETRNVIWNTWWLSVLLVNLNWRGERWMGWSQSWRRWRDPREPAE